MSEFKLIDKICKTMDFTNSIVALGPGDDCAVIDSHCQKSLVTVDTLMDGVHFEVNKHSPEEIAHKSVCVNLSDIAAMGGTPEYMVLSLCLPKDTPQKFCDRFTTRINQLCSTYQFSLAGGDTNSWDGPLVISITMFGRPHSKGVVLRSGAKPGDWIFVTGPLGGSIEKHHISFTPQLEVAKQILDQHPINSMIDLSDGLGSDLRHILRASNVGAKLYQDRLPSRKNISHLPRKEKTKRILSDGEDFELCYTVDKEQGAQIEEKRQHFHIGEITKTPNLIWEHNGEKILSKGYEHQLSFT